MRLHILNDLHVEFGEFCPPETDAHVAVLAGDIGVGKEGLDWAKEHFLDKPVIYVPGNHEFYHHDITLIDELKTGAPDNIHVLNNDMIEIDGVRFLGSVLWTDFALFGETEKWFSVQRAQWGMNDFAIIRNNGRLFSPDDSIQLHEVSRAWLARALAEPYAGKTVVVTHHAPSPQSVPPRFAKDLLTPAFASNLEGLMGQDRVNLWIHGHTHDAFDYVVYGTRVVCNPRGYMPHELTREFKPDFAVEI
ncbi:MAG: metallophosphoesterase [Gammaproteobacteria bacterium]